MARHAFGAPIASVPKLQAEVLCKVSWPKIREAVSV